MNKIKNEQREAIVRKAIAERDALLSGAQPAPQAGAAKFDCLPAILGDLRHSARVDGYTEDQRGFMEAIAVRLETRINAMSGPLPAPVTHPTEQPSQDAEDAARYRHLRNKSEPNREGDKPWCTVRDNKGYAWAFGSALDATVDAARAAQAQGEKGGAP